MSSRLTSPDRIDYSSILRLLPARHDSWEKKYTSSKKLEWTKNASYLLNVFGLTAIHYDQLIIYEDIAKLVHGYPHAYNLKRRKDESSQKNLSLVAIQVVHGLNLSLELSILCTEGFCPTGPWKLPILAQIKTEEGCIFSKKASSWWPGSSPGLKAIHLEHRRLIRLLSILWLALCRIKWKAWNVRFLFLPLGMKCNAVKGPKK